jgi:hypothetical protein
MRSSLARTLAIATTLVVAAIGLSACVTHAYDPYPRYGYNDRHDHRWDGRRDRGWVDRDGDGRRDWWENRR